MVLRWGRDAASRLVWERGESVREMGDGVDGKILVEWLTGGSLGGKVHEYFFFGCHRGPKHKSFIGFDNNKYFKG